MHQYVVATSQHPELYADRLKNVKELSEISIQCASCNTTVTFTNDDILLGPKPHNHPLFVTGYIKEYCIVIDGGSTIDIMPKSTMNHLGNTIEEHSKSPMMSQGLNLEG